MAALTPISSAFIWRRVHSLMGFWIVIYLIEHLLVNSQAALWIGDDGIGFIRLVNLIQTIPYLQVVETLLIGVPLLVHAVWGIKRALSAKSNLHGTSGKTPSLNYERNRAFTWQRMSSWILLIGIILHVVQMRFLDHPKRIERQDQATFLIKVSYDSGLETLLPRLDSQMISSDLYSLKRGEVVVETPSFGTATLLAVRNTFKDPWMCAFYTLFVLAAAFHAFNGLWTFLITWGLILSYRSQKAMLPVSWVGMSVLAFWGLAAIWCSYWVNLYK